MVKFCILLLYSLIFLLIATCTPIILIQDVITAPKWINNINKYTQRKKNNNKTNKRCGKRACNCGICTKCDCRKCCPTKQNAHKASNNSKKRTHNNKKTSNKCCKRCICGCKNCCTNCFQSMKRLYDKYLKFYKKYLGVGTAAWIFRLMYSEMGEILFQSFTLIYYNGYNIFNPQQLVLGYKQIPILTFAVFLGVNSILCGIFWCLYLTIPKMFHGFFFKQLLFVFDTIFDFFYAAFPLVVVLFQTNWDLTTAVGTLQTSQLYV